MDKARSRVVNKDAKGNMIVECSNLGIIPDFVAFICVAGERKYIGHSVLKVSTWSIISSSEPFM